MPQENDLPDSPETESTEPKMDANAKLAQALLDKKAAIAKKTNQPPFPKQRPNHRGKRIGDAPRGTRKTMGKR